MVSRSRVGVAPKPRCPESREWQSIGMDFRSWAGDRLTDLSHFQHLECGSCCMDVSRDGLRVFEVFFCRGSKGTAQSRCCLGKNGVPRDEVTMLGKMVMVVLSQGKDCTCNGIRVMPLEKPEKHVLFVCKCCFEWTSAEFAVVLLVGSRRQL